MAKSFDMGGKVSVPAGKSTIGKSVPSDGAPIGKQGSPVKTIENQPTVAKKGGAFGSGTGVIKGFV